MTTAPSADAIRPDGQTFLAFAGVVLFGGINALAVKASVAELAPLWSAGGRFAVAGLPLIVIAAATKRSFPRGRSFTGALLYGVLAFAASYALLCGRAAVS